MEVKQSSPEKTGALNVVLGTPNRLQREDLRALTSALGESNVIVRRWDGTIEHWTAGCERLYGWSSKQAVGRNCVGLLKSRLPIPLEEVERELLRTGQWVGEVEQERHDRSRIAVATHWVTLVEKDPRTPRVIETQT